jgi:hypothetical protein
LVLVRGIAYDEAAADEELSAVVRDGGSGEEEGSMEEEAAFMYITLFLLT